MPARRPASNFPAIRTPSLALAAPHTPVLPTKEFAGKTPSPYGDFVSQIDADVGALMAARAIAGWKKLVKVSGQSRTVGRPLRSATKPSRNVLRAKAGSLRSRWMPPSRFTIPDSGPCVIPFAKPGIRDASRAHQGISPMA